MKSTQSKESEPPTKHPKFFLSLILGADSERIEDLATLQLIVLCQSFLALIGYVPSFLDTQ